MDTHSVNGLAFTLSDGYAVFDAAGKSTASGRRRLCDSDGDGLPDLLENRSGTGAYNSNPDYGETDWINEYNSHNGLNRASVPFQVFTPLKAP